jgi:hypothetical protein
MINNCVITGDIIGFTAIPTVKRKKLLTESSELLSSWVEDPAYARIFRGDSFQILFKDVETALKRAVQLRCWFKEHSSNKFLLDARMVIGVGKISYYGKSVLDSDGEAFHLSGRTFDKLEEGENLSIVTANQSKNEQLKIILNLAEVIMSNWTINQAEVIYLLLEDKTQQQMAEELKIGQSAVNNRLKLAKWKQIEKMLSYIVSLIETK